MKNPNHALTKFLVSMTLVFMVITIASCNKKKWPNRVDIDQINYDDSTNYDQIFKDQIQKQEERDNRYKKDKF